MAMLETIPDFTENELVEVISAGINILGLMGIIVDPTTEGVSDSERALTYYKSEIN